MRSVSGCFRQGAVLGLLVLCAGSVTGEEWSRFRGPNGSGVSEQAAFPESFDGDDSLVWSAEVPFGRSSPVIAGDRIFMTAIAADRLVTMALTRESGELLWWRSIERDHEASLHPETDSSTPSPATDGENVYAFFHEAGLVSYDREGRERWRKQVGTFRNYYSIAASPILVGELVLLQCDQAGGSFLLAVHRDSGEEVWRQSRTSRRESYSTPVLYPNASEPRMVLVAGSKHLDAYAPDTGQHLWEVSGFGAGPVASPVVDGNRVFAVAPNQTEEPLEPFEGMLAGHDANGDGRLVADEMEGHWTAKHFAFVDFDGDGWLTIDDWASLNDEMSSEGWGLFAVSLAAGDDAPEIIWNYRPNASYIPTPVVVGGVVYMVKDSILTGLDAETGELLKRGRLDAKKVYASPVAAGGRMLIGSVEGQLSLIEPGRDWRVLSTHDLQEEIYAAPAISDGTVYIRTRDRLLAFAAGD